MITIEDRNVSNEVELRNGKANPFGWSYYELWHAGQKIGEIYCGEPKITDSDYRHECVQSDDGNIQLVIYLKGTAIEAALNAVLPG